MTVRDRAPARGARGLEVEPVEADVLDRGALRRALAGCDCSSTPPGWSPRGPRREVWRVNAVAPRIAVECAAEAGVRRVVRDLERGASARRAAAGPRTSGSPIPQARHRHDLPRRQARGRAGGLRRRASGSGVEVVAVNPAYVLGAPVNRALPGETSTRIVGNYLRGRLPAIVDSYTNIVDVEDVAAGPPARRRARAGRASATSSAARTCAGPR